MKQRNYKIFNLVILLSLCIFYSLSAQECVERSSPYFVVISEEGSHANLPLESTSVDVNISGVIADVNVKQVYTNAGDSTIEAIYVFPASTQAAVYHMVMTIGDRKIVAKIEEKKKARSNYNRAKSEGKTASLLEEERPNVFKMNVANIVPGAKVEVVISYTELLVPTDKIYEFVYPTVVGPRYVSSNEIQTKKNVNWNSNPYLEEEKTATSTLGINVHLNGGMPIQSIQCDTHKNKVTYSGKTNATIVLNEPEGGNRDFVLHYKLAGNKINTGVLLYNDNEGENYFVAMVQPPERIKSEIIPAREYIFIVDVSGSMNGFPLETSKDLMRNLLGSLKETDLFNIVFFAGNSYIYEKESIPVNKRNIDDAIGFIDNCRAAGGTELLCALQAAMGLNEKPDFARSFVIITDGFVSVEKETFDYIRENLGNANFFSFGIGSSVNRYIIEGMAHVGYGEPFIALNSNEAFKVSEKFEKYISQPVLTNITYSFDGFDAYDILPESLPDLFAERPIIISGKYRGEAKGTINIAGVSGKEHISEKVNIANDNTSNGALKYLWAREKIHLLADYASLSRVGDTGVDIVTEITELGLKYNLLTEYTSFIAIDSIVSNPQGKQTTVNQPLPLPKGVSASAVQQTIEMVDEDIEFNSEFGILEEEEEVDAPVFFIVEQMPEFPGGELALRNFIQSNAVYPKAAKRKEIQGRVYVSFVIDERGYVTNVKVARGVDPLLDAEAVRVVNSMPRWKPGMQRGKAIKTSYTIPIYFGPEMPVSNIKKKRRKQNQVSPANSIEQQEHPYKVTPC